LRDREKRGFDRAKKEGTQIELAQGGTKEKLGARKKGAAPVKAAENAEKGKRKSHVGEERNRKRSSGGGVRVLKEGGAEKDLIRRQKKEVCR